MSRGAHSAANGGARRTTWVRCALVASILALVAGRQSRAQDPWKLDTRIGDFQFDMPNGWKQVSTTNGPAITPTDAAPNAVALIAFAPSEQLAGDLRSWFDAHWAQWRARFRVVDNGQPDADRTPQGLERLRVYTRISSPAIGFASFVFAAIRVGDHVESYYYVNNTDRWSYLNDLTDLERGLRVANAPAAVASDDSGAAQTGGAIALDGLYVGYKMRGLAGLQSHFEYLVFFPDGNALRTLPWEGLEHVDFAAMVKHSREYCGRYRVLGDRLTVTWGDNSVETAIRSGGTLKFGHDSYFPVSSADGLALDGAYSREGADLASRSIRFTPGGRFTEDGMLPLIAYSLTSENHIAQSPGSGTYRLAKNTLTLAYDDGRRVALSFYVLASDEGGQRPSAIHVETFRLVRNQ